LKVMKIQTHTWPIVISVETEDVGVGGESRDGP
jgi:hypothetical protein